MKRRSPHIPGRKLAEGKSKTITVGKDRNTVVLTSNDIVSFSNGLIQYEVSGKGADATRLAAAAFRLLNAKGIPNHFIAAGGRLKSNALLAQQLWMIPVEVVVRRLAAGSHLKRYPDQELGQKIPGGLSVELYWKSDKNGDPLMIIDDQRNVVHLFDQSKPFKSGYIGEMDRTGSEHLVERARLKALREKGVELAKNVFAVLSMALAKYNIILADLKIEVGQNVFGQYVVGDILSLECCRLWVRGNPKKMLDRYSLLRKDGKVPSLKQKERFRAASRRVTRILEKAAS